MTFIWGCLSRHVIQLCLLFSSRHVAEHKSASLKPSSLVCCPPSHTIHLSVARRQLNCQACPFSEDAAGAYFLCVSMMGVSLGWLLFRILSVRCAGLRSCGKSCRGEGSEATIQLQYGYDPHRNVGCCSGRGARWVKSSTAWQRLWWELQRWGKNYQFLSQKDTPVGLKYQNFIFPLLNIYFWD